MTSVELYKIVKQKLANGQPLFVPRMGDGEAILLNGFEDEDKLNWVFKRQLGYVPAANHIEEIRLNLIQAYQKADIIGMPENKREGLNKYWYKCHQLLMDSIGTLPPLTTNDYHNEWLDNGTLAELLTDRERLYYVSCHNLDQQIKDRYNISEVKGFQISPEHAFFPGNSGNHYPDQFKKVEDWIDGINMKGCLFIYGAGIVGKIYGAWAAMQGAVALDLGNCFDLLAGYKTRGEGRGAGVRIEKYKI